MTRLWFGGDTKMRNAEWGALKSGKTRGTAELLLIFTMGSFTALTILLAAMGILATQTMGD